MSRNTCRSRRSFLTLSGTVLGGIATGGTVVASASPDRFLVDTTQRSLADIEAAGLDVIHDLSAIDTVVVHGAEADVQSLNTQYAADTRFALEMPTDVTSDSATLPTTTDPPTDAQWDKKVQNLSAVHDLTRGEQTRVAVIDTGIASGHPALDHAVNKELSQNFTVDDYGVAGPYGGFHGTHVAGIIAAAGNIVGTAPATELVDCRVYSPGKPASFADILAAIVYSTTVNADAMNLSLGFYPVARQNQNAFYGKVLNRATAHAHQNGTLIIAAAGNDGADLQHDKNYIGIPTEAANTVVVSATGPNGYRWGDDGLTAPFHSPSLYTNYGTNVIDVAAPGGNMAPRILEALRGSSDSALEPGWYQDFVLNTIAFPRYDETGAYQGAKYGYAWALGTSMACPQVVGAAALLRSQSPDMTAGSVRATLKRSADRVDTYDKAYYGSGFLNPHAALTE